MSMNLLTSSRDQGFPNVLVPYHGMEAITVPQAEHITGIAQTTLRRWCAEHGLGRRVGGSVRQWSVSRVALAMFLDGNSAALAAYHRGDRSSDLVSNYFRREGLTSLVTTAGVT